MRDSKQKFINQFLMQEGRADGINVDDIIMQVSMLKPFRFEMAWLKHDKFDSFIRAECNNIIYNMVKEVDKLNNKLKDWNRNAFGNIFFTKRSYLQGLVVFNKNYVLPLVVFAKF